MNAGCYVSKDVRYQLLEGLFSEPWEFEDSYKSSVPNNLPPQLVSDRSPNVETLKIELPQTSTHSKPLEMEFVLIPKGSFMMGRPI